LFGKPWNENYADLPLALGLDLILVVNNRLGCLNGAPLSLDYGVRRGWRVAGYILNDAAGDNSPATRSNGASLRRLTTIQCLGEIGRGAPIPPEVYRRLLSSARP
jgi:dethiobiotin synthetase